MYCLESLHIRLQMFSSPFFTFQLHRYQVSFIYSWNLLTSPGNKNWLVYAALEMGSFHVLFCKRFPLLFLLHQFPKQLEPFLCSCPLQCPKYWSCVKFEGLCDHWKGLWWVELLVPLVFAKFISIIIFQSFESFGFDVPISKAKASVAFSPMIS